MRHLLQAMHQMEILMGRQLTWILDNEKLKPKQQFIYFKHTLCSNKSFDLILTH